MPHKMKTPTKSSIVMRGTALSSSAIEGAAVVLTENEDSDRRRAAMRLLAMSAAEAVAAVEAVAKAVVETA